MKIIDFEPREIRLMAEAKLSAKYLEPKETALRSQKRNPRRARLILSIDLLKQPN